MPENSCFSSEVNVAGLQGLRITSFHLWAVRPWMLQGSSGMLFMRTVALGEDRHLTWRQRAFTGNCLMEPGDVER